jgi:superfamily I DNA/RNA helicase
MSRLEQLIQEYCPDEVETIRILQENPTIVESLAARENGVFVDESESINYV